MAISNSSPKLGLSPSDSVSDPEEIEISDDDDDRNHKHRRRDAQSRSMEREPIEQVSTRPYIKRNKIFENGHPYSNANSPNDSWRNYNVSTLENGFPGKFDKRGPPSEPLSRALFDFNHRSRGNQSFSGDSSSGRGRGGPGSWSQHDYKFGFIDTTPPMVQQAVPHLSLFPGRGMPTVSNLPGLSWSTLGLVPGLPSAVKDTLHSCGPQRNLRGPINPTINLGTPHQRCRDFEERGFCLRGDMCPIEHGINRIVVEDVQSLSQFNLPVSLPSVHLAGASTGSGPLSAANAASSTLSNRKVLYSRSNKSGAGEDDLCSNNAFIGSDRAGASDFYDPDQPLWTNDRSKTTMEPLPCNQTKVDETETVLAPSDNKNIGFYEGSDNDCPVETSVGPLGTSLPAQTQICSLKNRPEFGEINNSGLDSCNYTVNTTKEDQKLLKTAQGATAHQGKQIGRSFQKAHRTLFVSGIPPINNTRDALLSHFWKFGEIIDIYIPLNSERAFVQFSKREEAEDALKAPDAVMGNRFIKLWWANRDNVPESGINIGSSVPLASRVMTNDLVPACPVLTNRGKDTPRTKAPKSSIPHASFSTQVAADHAKPAFTNGPLPPTHKKLDSLKALKELRRKQEMLDQKRNDLKRLDLYEKQATGLIGDVALEQTTKRHKLGTMASAAAAAKPTSSDLSKESKQAEKINERTMNGDNVVPQSPETCTTVALQETLSLKQSIRQAAAGGAPFVINRFKLDNRPTSFKIVPPLPIGLANIAALKEHFSKYGEVSAVNPEESELKDDTDDSILSKIPVCIHFATRHSAEKAFTNGKCWKGHNMQFVWLTPKNSRSKEALSSTSSRGSSDVNDQIAEAASAVSQKTVISEDVESQDSERRHSAAEDVEPGEVFHSNSSPSVI